MKLSTLRSCFLVSLCVASLAGCYSIRPSDGGGQTDCGGVRHINPSDIAVPAGYRITPVASEFTFPTAVTVGESGDLYVVESGYSYGEIFTTPKPIKVDSNG